MGIITNCSYFGIEEKTSIPSVAGNIDLLRLRGKGQAGYFFGGMVRNSERDRTNSYDSYLTT